MKAYSKDLRERIIGALEARAGTQPEIAERFSVSLSFVEKLWRRWRQTGSCEAKPPGGGRRRALKECQPVIRAEVANYPDVTLAELCERVAQSDGVRASISMMCRELKKLLMLPDFVVEAISPPRRGEMFIETWATNSFSPSGAASTTSYVAPDGAWTVVHHRNYKHVAPSGL